jgi:hypothetical protein
MNRTAIKWIAIISLITITAALNYKLLGLRELVLSGTFETERKVEKTAEKIRKGEKIFSSDNMANLLVVSNDRSPERYMFNFYSLFSIVISNLAIFGCFLSYYLGGRKMQKNIQSGN